VLEENYVWGYDRQRQLIMKVERSKNRLHYLDLDRVDPICDGFLVEEQRSAPFPYESTHVTQDVIYERGKSGQPEGSLENGRPPWPEGGGLKENSSPEEASLKGPEKRKAGYTCIELLNIAVASSRPIRPEGGRAANSQAASSEKSASLTASMEVPRAGGLTSPGTLSAESSPAKCSPSIVPAREEERSYPAQFAPDRIEALIPARIKQPRYACIQLMELATRELSCTWLHDGQKHRPELYPLGNELASFVMHDRVDLVEKVLRQEHISESSRSDVGPQLAKKGSESEERSATSVTEEYVVTASIALEPKRLQPIQACMQRVLNCYLKKALWTVNNPVKVKHEKQCLLSEEPVKTEDADKKDGSREAMEKPAKTKTVIWMLQGTTKAMSMITAKTAKVVPRVTPTRSRWRIWDPGRNEAVVLRGVIVRNKHVRGAVSQSYTERIRVWRCPGRSSVSYPSMLGSRLNLIYIGVYSTL
jgi:hypothetical protein